MKRGLVMMAAVALVAVAAGVQAQERTAGQAQDAQVNWSALRIKIDMVSAQNKALAAMLDKIQACNATRKIYAPTDDAADGNGCVAISGFKLGDYTLSANDTLYKRDVTYKAATDLMVLAYNSGSGEDRSACYVTGNVDGKRVAFSYAKRYTSFISFLVPKGSTWMVTMRKDRWCTSGSSAINTIAINPS